MFFFYKKNFYKKILRKSPASIFSDKILKEADFREKLQIRMNSIKFEYEVNNRKSNSPVMVLIV